MLNALRSALIWDETTLTLRWFSLPIDSMAPLSQTRSLRMVWVRRGEGRYVDGGGEGAELLLERGGERLLAARRDGRALVAVGVVSHLNLKMLVPSKKESPLANHILWQGACQREESLRLS